MKPRTPDKLVGKTLGFFLNPSLRGRRRAGYHMGRVLRVHHTRTGRISSITVKTAGGRRFRLRREEFIRPNMPETVGLRFRGEIIPICDFCGATS